MLLRCRTDANRTDRHRNVPDTPAMRRFKRVLASHRRIDAALAEATVDALDAGEKQIELARLMGRSREYVRLLVEAERKRRQS